VGPLAAPSRPRPCYKLSTMERRTSPMERLASGAAIAGWVSSRVGRGRRNAVASTTTTTSDVAAAATQPLSQLRLLDLPEDLLTLIIQTAIGVINEGGGVRATAVERTPCEPSTVGEATHMAGAWYAQTPADVAAAAAAATLGAAAGGAPLPPPILFSRQSLSAVAGLAASSTAARDAVRAAVSGRRLIVGADARAVANLGTRLRRLPVLRHAHFHPPTVAPAQRSVARQVARRVTNSTAAAAVGVAHRCRIVPWSSTAADQLPVDGLLSAAWTCCVQSRNRRVLGRMVETPCSGAALVGALGGGEGTPAPRLRRLTVSCAHISGAVVAAAVTAAAATVVDLSLDGPTVYEALRAVLDTSSTDGGEGGGTAGGHTKSPAAPRFPALRRLAVGIPASNSDVALLACLPRQCPGLVSIHLGPEVLSPPVDEGTTQSPPRGWPRVPTNWRGWYTHQRVPVSSAFVAATAAMTAPRTLRALSVNGLACISPTGYSPPPPLNALVQLLPRLNRLAIVNSATMAGAVFGDPNRVLPRLTSLSLGDCCVREAAAQPNLWPRSVLERIFVGSFAPALTSLTIAVGLWLAPITMREWINLVAALPPSITHLSVLSDWCPAPWWTVEFVASNSLRSLHVAGGPEGWRVYSSDMLSPSVHLSTRCPALTHLVVDGTAVQPHVVASMTDTGVTSRWVDCWTLAPPIELMPAANE